MKLPIDSQFLSVATSFVENCATSFGFKGAEAMALTLATEELFTYLSHIGHSNAEMKIICSKGSCFARTDIHFPAGLMDHQAFNITAKASHETQDELDKLGLILAARSVDNFQVAWPDPRNVRLTLIKEKKYPRAEASEPIAVKPLTELFIRKPEPAETKLFAQLATQLYPGRSVPSFMRYPGKVVDMIAGGDLSAAIAVDASGRIGGGIGWRWDTPNTVAFFGPYLFGQPEGLVMGKTLVDELINVLARGVCVNLISRFATPETPGHYFQELGTIVFPRGEGWSEHAALFMQLKEDPGLKVWGHPILQEFLISEFDRLSLPREIEYVSDGGEERHKNTVLATELDRDMKSAHLRPSIFGLDVESVIRDHLDLFCRENISSTLFELDLGVSEYTSFAPYLMEAGFVPRLLMPNGGKGDVLLLQRLEGGRAC
ncbi:MAG: hypothetical protein KQI78_14730 [Deltaproteobacteria bacterium]|nr:hypothetical protein [Deltaproteobacteria bacterium]